MGEMVPRSSFQLEDRQLPKAIGPQLIFEPIQMHPGRQPDQVGAQAILEAQRFLATELGAETTLQVTDRHQPQGQPGPLHQQAVAMAVDQPGQGR
jgi:hypothetical protein